MSQSNNHELKDLIGKKITALDRSQDSEWLRFQFDGGELLVAAEGDCCSECWFEEILNPDFIVGHTVADVRDLDENILPSYPDSGRQESDLTYGVQITTDAGRASPIYRNSSNGYYGGMIYVRDSAPKNIVWETVKEK